MLIFVDTARWPNRNQSCVANRAPLREDYAARIGLLIYQFSDFSIYQSRHRGCRYIWSERPPKPFQMASALTLPSFKLTESPGSSGFGRSNAYVSCEFASLPMDLIVGFSST